MKIVATFAYLTATVAVLCSNAVDAQNVPPIVDDGAEEVCVACEDCAAAGDQCVTDIITDISCLPGVCELIGDEPLCLACELCQNQLPDCDLADVLEASCNLCGEDVAGTIIDIINGVPDVVDTVQDTANSACFSELATVLVEGTADGVAMKDLQVGDRILTTSGKYEPVYSFGHWHATLEAEFLQFHHVHQEEVPLEVTKDHLIYVQGQDSPVPAHTIKVGDLLGFSSYTKNNTYSAVTEITSVQRRGIYAPLTASGTLVVDGVAASSYIQINHQKQQQQQQHKRPVSDHALVHGLIAPFRMGCSSVHTKSLFLCDKYHSSSGMPYYVHHGWHLVQWISNSSNAIVSTLGWSLLLLVTAIFQGTESLVNAPVLLVGFVGVVAVYATTLKKTTQK